MTFTIAVEQDEDGGWMATVAELPGVVAYGATPDEARAKVQEMASGILAERSDESDEEEEDSSWTSVFFEAGYSLMVGEDAPEVGGPE